MRLYNFNKFNVESICIKWGIENWTIQDGLVNVYGDVMLSGKKISKILLKFGEVSGNFNCYNNQLTTLEGSPERVGGSFYCSHNNLTSLEGSTQEVGGGFYCSYNQLTTLVGGPKEVLGRYDCSSNKLTDVRGFPEYYRGEVLIYDNPVYRIISLFKGVDVDIVIETLNDYNVIRKGKVDLQLLKYAFDALEISMPEIEYIKRYEII